MARPLGKPGLRLYIKGQKVGDFDPASSGDLLTQDVHQAVDHLGGRPIREACALAQQPDEDLFVQRFLSELPRCRHRFACP